MDTPRPDTLDYLAILRGMVRRHKILVAGIFLGLAIPALAFVYYTSRPLYVSTATIAIESSPLEQLPFIKQSPMKEEIAAHMVLLKSRSLREGVLEALPRESFEELLANAQYTDYVLLLTNTVKRWLGKPPTVLSPQQRAAAELANARIQFEQSRDASGVFIIRAGASNPRVAMDLVNTHIQVLLSRTRGTNQEEVRKAREFLEAQLQQAMESLNQGEQSLTRFQQQQGRIKFSTQTEYDLVKFFQTETALAETQASREVLATRISAMRQMVEQAKANEIAVAAESQAKEKERAAATSTSSPSAEYQAAFNTFKASQERLAKLEARLAAFRDRYTEAHPLVQLAQEEVASQQARVAQLARELPAAPPPPKETRTTPQARAEVQRQLEALETEYATHDAKEEMLRLQVQRLRGSLKNLSQEEREFGGLRRGVETQRNLLSILSDKLMATRIREQGESSVTRIIDPASFPAQQSQSKDLRLVLMLLAACGGVAFVAAFGIEYWRQPIETEEDVLKATDLPVLGYVGVIGKAPADGKRTGSRKRSPSLPVHLTSISAPARIHIELYRAIRAGVETERLKSPFSSILVTSPGPNEGKSTTVLNLAHVFQEFGRRVLVVEADLRRPALHRTLSLTNTPGFADFLEGRATFAEVCRLLPSGLTVIPSHAVRGDTASMLASPRAKELLDLARAQFDLILVDSPPLLAVPDNLLLVTLLDRVIFVAKASATSKRDLRRAQTTLQQANAQILGVVLNQANPRDVHYYHPRYRKYYKTTEGKEAPQESRCSRLLSWRGRK